MRAQEVVEKPRFDIPQSCEGFREIVNKYFGDKTDEALFVASKESRRCTVNISDGPNKNGTYDYCIFQINNEPKTRIDTNLCVARAWKKYTGGRVGVNNWSAWYAVCTPEANPKFERINCK